MNPGGELGDGETPKIGVVKGERTLALHRCVSLGSIANAGRDPIDKKLAPLDVCPRRQGSRRLWERGLNGVGDKGGGVFELCEGGCRSAYYDQVALRRPPCSGQPDVGVAGGIAESLVTDCDKGCRCRDSLLL